MALETLLMNERLQTRARRAATRAGRGVRPEPRGAPIPRGVCHDRRRRAASTRRFTFSAGHRYWVASWSAEENERVFGRLTVPHGHNYTLDVTVRGPIDPQTGMVIDLGELKRIVGETVVDRFDHADLNADALFRDRVPTTENIAHRRVGAAGAQARRRSPLAGPGVGGPHALRGLSMAPDACGRAHARLPFQRGPPAGESGPVGRGQRGALRPVPPAARPQLLPGGHRGRRPRPADGHGGGSRARSTARSRDALLDARRPPARWRRSRRWPASITTGEGLARAFWRIAGAGGAGRRAADGSTVHGDGQEPTSSTEARRRDDRTGRIAAAGRAAAEGAGRGRRSARASSATPERVEKALRYLTSGYGKDVKEILNDALFVEEYDEMVIVKDIDFTQPVRASPAAVHRQVPRGLHAAPQDRRPVEDPAAGRDVQPAAAGAGAADDPDRQHAERGAAAARRRRRHGGGPPLHAHARGGEAELQGRHLGRCSAPSATGRRRAPSSWS